jgi:hypothetical protein
MPKAQPNEIRMRQHEHRAEQYAAYHADLHAEVNQARRLVKHLETHGHDDCAVNALGALPREALEQVPHALDWAARKVGHG